MNISVIALDISIIASSDISSIPSATALLAIPEPEMILFIGSFTFLNVFIAFFNTELNAALSFVLFAV